MNLRFSFLAALTGLALAACGGEPAKTADFKPVPVTPFLGDVTMGNEAATVSIVEYASLACPHCRDFWMQVFPRIKAAYIDTGKVKYTFRDLPIHEDGFDILLATIARCKGKDDFYALVDDLFASQTDIALAAQKKEAGPVLVQVAGRHGLTKDQIRTCMDYSPELKASVLKSQKDAGDRMSKEGHLIETPTIYVNDEYVANHTFEDLSKVIEAKLAGVATPTDVTKAPASPTTTAGNPGPTSPVKPAPAPATPPAKPPA